MLFYVQLRGNHCYRASRTIELNAYSAEFGRSAGGVINAVTRSGENRVHTSAFEFLRNSALDAKNFFDPFDKPIPPFKRNQFGATAPADANAAGSSGELWGHGYPTSVDRHVSLARCVDLFPPCLRWVPWPPQRPWPCGSPLHRYYGFVRL